MAKLFDRSITYKPSNEEKFVQHYLESNNIKHKPQFRLNNLKGDEKFSYRDVDFFLPKFGVYVEYYGWYNKSKHHREQYDIKTQIYIKNDLPTIVIYPHELGFLDYAFHTKMIKLLNIPKFKSSKNMFRYKANRFHLLGKSYFFLLAFVTLLIGLSALTESKHNYDFYFFIYITGFTTTALLMREFFLNFYYIFFKDD